MEALDHTAEHSHRRKFLVRSDFMYLTQSETGNVIKQLEQMNFNC